MTSVFRAAAVSYLRFPAPRPPEVGAFYEAVFGWSLRESGTGIGFTDGSGHVIGHFLDEQPVAGEAGVRPYVYVDDIDATIASIDANGGEIVTGVYPEGDLWVATFRDPAGNVVGVWQQGPRGR